MENMENNSSPSSSAAAGQNSRRPGISRMALRRASTRNVTRNVSEQHFLEILRSIGLIQIDEIELILIEGDGVHAFKKAIIDRYLQMTHELESMKLENEKQKTEHAVELTDLKGKLNLQIKKIRKLEQKVRQYGEETNRRNLMMTEFKALSDQTPSRNGS